MSFDAKVMTVVSAIRQSLQTSASPGSSVNTHPNPFFINVQGEVNLKHAAELIIQRLQEYDEALRTKAELEIRRAHAAELQQTKPEGQ